ncbi:MAG: NUDIX hydrolase, partial [Flavobacteriales bacterium]
MILKKQIFQSDKKASPFIGLLLFLISIVLLLLTGPFGFIYGLFHSLFTKGIKGLGEYLLQIAISIDQLGNVLMQHLLNVLWIKKEGYKFGNRDETISSALGRNKNLGTLTLMGRTIDRILDVIDANHSLNSVDYYVEPSHQIIDLLAWILVVDGKLLMLYNANEGRHEFPGGPRVPKSSDFETLSEHLKTKLNLSLQHPSFQFMGVFEANNDRLPKGKLVRISCYTSDYKGIPIAQSAGEEMIWLDYDGKHKVLATEQLIFDSLKN